jgi:hypothetical protein
MFHEVGDQLGRIGTGLVEAHRGERVELIFARDRSHGARIWSVP